MCSSRLQLSAHIARRMAFNPKLADHAPWIQLGATSRCTIPSENKATSPLVQTNLEQLSAKHVYFHETFNFPSPTQPIYIYIYVRMRTQACAFLRVQEVTPLLADKE